METAKRSIPAHAGETAKRYNFELVAQVYPRARGGNL